jgi:hypothetical protein
MNKSLRVAAARDLGPQFTDNSFRIVGLDGAFSISLADRQTLWFFGDTLIGRRIPGQSMWFVDGQPVGPADMSHRGSIDLMINNTGLIFPPQRASKGLAEFDFIVDESGNPRPLIPLEGDEHPDRDRIWCQHGIALGDRVYLSFIKVRMKPIGSCPFPVCFDIVGSGLVVGSTVDWRFRRIARDGDPILWSAENPHFATAFLAAGEYIYLYGTVVRNDVQRCFLARTRFDRIESIDTYEYFTGPGPAWSHDISRAVSIFDHMPSELSVSWNDHLGAYLAIHSLDLTGNIVARTAPAPWGPWSGPTILWSASSTHPAALSYPTLVYAGKEHPELSEQGGRVIYLTYVEFEEYFPRLIEVTLE